MSYGTVTGRNLDRSPTFGSNLRFTLSLSSSPTSRNVFQSTRKYSPFRRLVGTTGSGARVVPPKDSSSATRFVPADVEESGDDVDASTMSELSFAESGLAGTTVVAVAVVAVVEETFTDSADKSDGEFSFLSFPSRALRVSRHLLRDNENMKNWRAAL